MVYAAGRKETGVNRCDHLGGGRSYDMLGNDILVHGRTSCGMLRSPADSLSTGVGSDASWMCSSYGGAMAGGSELSVLVGRRS